MVILSFYDKENVAYLRIFLLYYELLNILKMHYSYFDGEYHTWLLICKLNDQN